MSRVAVKITLTAAEKRELERNLAPDADRKLRQRSEIVLLAAEGLECIEIAERLGISEKTCRNWRKRFARERLDGLSDRQRPGAPRIFTPEERREIISIACEPPEDIRNWTLANITERVRERFGRAISVETIRLILRSADAGSMTDTTVKKQKYLGRHH